MPLATPATPRPNPFATRFVRPDAATYRFAPGQNAQAAANNLIQWLLRRGTAAIIGPHGTGKSTLVHTLVPALGQAFAAVERVQLSSSTDALAQLRAWQRQRRSDQTPTSARCLIIDGFEQLPWLTRQRLSLQAARWQPDGSSSGQRPPRPYLLVTAHRRQIGIQTWWRTAWDDRIVAALTEEKLCDLPQAERLALLAAAARRAAAVRRAAPEQRNVREYWFALYDEYERRRQPASEPIAAPDSVLCLKSGPTLCSAPKNPARKAVSREGQSPFQTEPGRRTGIR